VDERDWPEELDERIAAVATADNSYEAGLQVMGCAVDYLTTPVIASRLYQVWGDLTDRFELKPDERTEALDAMKQGGG
jgi:hypothetical protein